MAHRTSVYVYRAWTRSDDRWARLSGSRRLAHDGRVSALPTGTVTFLFTDAHGAAQHLYARLGFRRAWTVYRFSLRPPA